MKNKIFVLVVSLIVIGIIWYYKSTIVKQKPNDGDISNIELNLSKKKIFIFSNIHGVSGNHQRIIITEHNEPTYNKEVDYAFFTSELYYSIENDKVIVYAPESSILEPADSKCILKNLIIVKPLKTADEVNDYDENYENYSLNKVSVY